MPIPSLTFLPVAALTLIALTACQTTGSAPKQTAEATAPEMTVAELRATLKDRTFACKTHKGFPYQVAFADTDGDTIVFTYTNGKTGKSNDEAFLISGDTIRIKRDGTQRRFFDLGDGAFRSTGSKSPSDCTPMA